MQIFVLYRFRGTCLCGKGQPDDRNVHYDNGPNNASNPDSTRVIRWGDRSEDEMMTSRIEYLDVPSPSPLAITEASRR